MTDEREHRAWWVIDPDTGKVSNGEGYACNDDRYPGQYWWIPSAGEQLGCTLWVGKNLFSSAYEAYTCAIKDTKVRIAELHKHLAELEWELSKLQEGGSVNEASENRLARRLDRALSVLRQVEWCQWEQVAVDDVVNLCPLCDQVERKGHAPDCPLGAVLQEAST